MLHARRADFWRFVSGRGYLGASALGAKKVAKLPDDSSEWAWPPTDWVLFREGALEVAYTPFEWVNLPLTPSDLGRGPGSLVPRALRSECLLVRFGELAVAAGWLPGQLLHGIGHRGAVALPDDLVETND